MSVLHRLEEAGLSAVGAAVRSLSWTGAQRVGEIFGRVVQKLAGRRRRLTLANLRAAFPERAEDELKGWSRQSWENLGRIAAECLWAERRSAEEIARWVSFEGLEPLRDAIRGGEGALIHLGHFANWEVANMALSSLAVPLSVVARRIKNPYLDARTNAMRSRFGTQVLSHRDPFFRCVRGLKSGRCIGILMDQKLPTGGVFVPFFGRPAATTPLTAHLAHRTGRPIFALRLHREGPRIVGTFSGPVPLGSSVDDTAARLTALIEDWARERPGEWFWFHDRWKRSPPAAAPAPAA